MHRSLRSYGTVITILFGREKDRRSDCFVLLAFLFSLVFLCFRGKKFPKISNYCFTSPHLISQSHVLFLHHRITINIPEHHLEAIVVKEDIKSSRKLWNTVHITDFVWFVHIATTRKPQHKHINTEYILCNLLYEFQLYLFFISVV